MADKPKSFMGDLGANYNGTSGIEGFSSTPLPTNVGPAPVKNATSTAQQAPVVVNAPPPTYDDNAELRRHTGGAFTNKASALDQIELAFKPNILDNYDVYTYHWKLFIAPLSASSSGNVLDTSIQSIIAESGVSDLTIDKVEISGVATLSTETGSGTATTLKFEIVEPSGAGLIDKIFYESVALGIGNWMVSPYYLQLEFRGRDPATEETVINGAPNGLGALKWVWPVKLTSSKINVTQVGTRYEFDAVMYDESAQSNSYFAIQHSVTLKKLTKFGDAMVDLENKLNADAYEKLIDNYSIADTYKIVVDPILAAYNLVNPDANKNTARNSDYVDFSKKAATFNTGTGIDKIVDTLLGTTSLGQMGVQNSKTPAGQPNAPQEQKEHMKKLWRIVTETKPIAFDPLRQDNAVAITIFVVQYDVGVLEADAAQTGQTPATEPAAKDRFKEYMSKKILQKKYNYIFTGLNDQIIALDLNMNYSFAAATARFGGIYVDSAAGTTKGAAMQDHAGDEKKAGEIARKTLQFISDAAPGTDLSATVAAANKSIAATKISQAKQDQIAEVLKYAQPANKKALADKKAATLAQSAANAKSLAIPQNGLHFVSDVNVSAAAGAAITAQTSATSAALAKGKLRPIPTRDAVQEGNFKGVDPSADAGRARTSSMFATALQSNLDGSMQSIKLTIKGDPFWLFPRGIAADAKSLMYKSNMPPADAIADIKLAQKRKNAEESANIIGTDNFLIVRFRTPRIYNDTTGSIDPFTEVESFSGVYKLVRVVSKFAVGKFTQDIECILDPVINLSDTELSAFMASIEKSSQTIDPVTQSSSNSLPPAAVKTQPLASNANLPKGQDSTKGVNPTATNKPTSNIPSSSGLTAAQRLAQNPPPQL